ncbi:amino acid adenylation domain-containing protein, partial [Anaerosporobacter sp.]|uniref:amino acid adenylation domain-containing protein n=1 Tax=Anaerosporobacter sp. TaxID=1872529 RepID=UPI00286F6259
MSSIQKRLYIINQVESGISYNTPKIFSVTGSIDRDKMKEAFEKLVDRYELLRTTFEDDGDSFYQVIHEEVDCVVQDFSSDKMLEDIVNEFLRPFELSKAPLMRIGIVRGIEREYLIVDFHHIICDAASVYIYMEDLLSFYGGQTLEPLELQYKDYAAWQLQKDMSDAKEFLENALKVEPERVDLKTDYLRPNEFKTAGNTYHEFSNSSLNEKVKKMCSQYNLSEFAVCLAGFFSFLARYVSQKNITLGIPMANRMHEATFDMPGMFVNTVVISEDVDVSISFMEFAHKIQDDLYQVLEYQDYPFDSLVEYLKVQRDPSRNPLFDIMFVYEGGSDGGRLATEDFSLEEVKEFGYNQAKFDLTFSVFGENDNYDISWEYCTELFGEKTIEYMHNIFKIYFSNLLDNSTSAMNDCALLDEREETHIFEKLEYKPHQIFKKSLLNVFEDNVRDIPEKLALMEKNRVMTFAELDAISSRIANYIKRNLQCERPVVAMLFDRSIDTIVTILAVLKSGAAFLPIEPSLPIERINYILKNSEAECVITNIKRNEDFFCKVIEFEEIKVLSKKENSVCDCQKLDENRLVYIIYTSGSTGNPKGVGINESSLMNYLDWAALEYIHGSEDCFGFYSPLSFDLTITSVFLPLLHGLSMHIYYADDYASSLMDLIEENKVTILKLTPSHMKMINQMDIENTNIHTFIVGGEELTVQTATETEEKINHSVSIINEYGPTEATIGCCYHKFDVDNDVTNVSIGRPIANTQLYVLDEQRNMLPYGVTGELYIAGEGLAVGYYNNEKMTNEKFVENPFESGKKMYATGDLAYKNFDGKYTYCGRKDTQTKLRGFRIELEEVEKIARREADASEAFAMIYKNNESDYLCAYLVGGIKDFEIIKEKMRKYLPDYMVPSFFVTVDQIPLTTNGKVDKKRLPMPDITIGREYIAPRTAKEEELLSVFSEVLGVKIGLGDYFFEVGGDSIKAIRVVSKIKEKGYKISLREIMSRQPMEKTISTVREKESASVEYKEMCGKYENSFIQEKFWNSKLAIPEHFNQSVLLEAANGVTGDIIGKCFEKLVKNHDMLRAKFPEKVLEIKNNTEDRLFGLQEFYFSDEGVDYETIIYENTKSLNASFDLANGPLIKALLLRFQTKTFLYITIHHLIVDSVSWGILLDDLNSYYGELIEDKEEYKPIRSASYAEWNNNLKDLNHSISVLREIDYWDRIEEYIGNNIEEYSYSRTDKLMLEPIEFDEGITKLLISKAILPYKMEVKDIIITALLRAMKKVYNDSNQVISMESHGRQNDYINIDIDRTIGWFTSFYPVMFEQIGEEQSQDLV